LRRKNCRLQGGEACFAAKWIRTLDHNTRRQAPEENAMTDTLTPTYRTAPGIAADESHDSAAAWSAIIAGALASIAMTLILLAFATGLGLAVVSPWADSGVSATTFKWGSGALMLLLAVMSSAVGGYVAGRLRTKWTGVHTDEIYFRDTVHGFLAWALATVVGVVLLASAASTIVGGAASGAGQAAGQAAGAAARNAGPMDGYIDTLLRSDPAANRNPADPAASRAELTRLLTKPLRTGEITAADRTYAAQMIAARTGIPQAEAEARITQVINQAKEAADAARKAALKFSLWLAATLLAGAFAASLAATEGGGLRDGTWKYRRGS
jgi:hypothetical protein